MYKVYEKTTNKDEKLLFIGFKDRSNFGHGSDSEVIATNDKRYQLKGTLCNDISGHQAFIPFFVTEISKPKNKLDLNLFRDAIENSGLKKEKLVNIENSFKLDKGLNLKNML
jgi:hypothetical protein